MVKKHNRRERPSTSQGKTSLWAILLVIVSTILVVTAQAMMKLRLNSGKDVIGLALDPFILGGVFLLIIGGVLLTVALKHGELSVLHPLLSLGFVWVIFASTYIGESVSTQQLFGVAIIVSGVSLIGKSRGTS